MSRKPEFYAAVFGIIKDENGNILFQKRQNTGFADGFYQLPSGHIEGEETYNEALIREMKEELGIDILEKNIKLVHISHRITKNDRVYFDIFFEITLYNGEITNTEPEKCSELKFLDYKNENLVINYNKLALENIEKGTAFSEVIY
ncbi:MAG: NUDIX domain-containing protein [Candidatus Gracilibacteria bacterium]|nr:NUDIX domain-containing protein [Candidatus Gracilibacteria bacterium]